MKRWALNILSVLSLAALAGVVVTWGIDYRYRTYPPTLTQREAQQLRGGHHRQLSSIHTPKHIQAITFLQRHPKLSHAAGLDRLQG